jgi:hypothetical protein
LLLPRDAFTSGLGTDLRDLSCRERCSDLLNARLQNWHLYRFSFSLSGAAPGARRAVGDVFWIAPATAAIVASLTISPAGNAEAAMPRVLVVDGRGVVGAGGSHYFAARRLSLTAKLGRSGQLVPRLRKLIIVSE